MGDRFSTEQRSYIMSRIRGKDTTIEVTLRSALHRAGLRFRKNVRGILGTPDIVFHGSRLLVFVDGDFWHGYRFPQWGLSLSVFWQRKILRNRARDRRYHAKLRRDGWRVVRVWEHQIHCNLHAVVLRIANLVEQDHDVNLLREKRLNETPCVLLRKRSSSLTS